MKHAKISVKQRPRPAASTADVLNLASPVNHEPPAKWRRQFKRLLELRAALLNRQEQLSLDAASQTPSFSTHVADAGTDTYDRDLALSMLSFEQNALYQIDQALDRIRQGTYGYCEMTGQRIEPERLEAVPWARFSLEVEEELEKVGRRKRVRLGARESVLAGMEEASEEAE